MKRIILIFTVILTTCLSASAYDFMVDGLAYNLNSDGKSVTVTYTERGNANYKGCSGSLVIPEKVTYNGKEYSVRTIGDYAFAHSGFTGSLTIPNSVKTIGEYAFRGCSGFTGSLTIGGSVTSIGDYAFRGCSGFTGSLTIPNTVITIGEYAFNGCTGLTHITISRCVTALEDCTFAGCTGLTGSLDIPSSVKHISSCVFYGCTGLTRITIPNSVTYIGAYAFYGCTGLTSVVSYMAPDDIYSYVVDCFSDDTYRKAVLYVPKNKFYSYKKDSVWSRFENIKAIEDSAVNDIHVDEEDGAAWYDLSGRIYQQKPTDQGIYIHNGKKVLVK